MFANIFSVISVGEESAVFGFVRGNMKKNFENHCHRHWRQFNSWAHEATIL